MPHMSKSGRNKSQIHFQPPNTIINTDSTVEEVVVLSVTFGEMNDIPSNN